MKKVNLKNLSAKELHKLFHKAAFSQFVDSTVNQNQQYEEICWVCCKKEFKLLKDVHRHVAECHYDEIKKNYLKLKEDYEKKVSEQDKNKYEHDDVKIEPNSEVESFMCICGCKDFVVLLFYHYVENPINHGLDTIKIWQVKLCRNLKLRGKIRLSTEGINGTVEGCKCGTDEYKSQILRQEIFTKMSMDDFKSSKGTGSSFDELSVTICQELCTLGLPPEDVSTSGGGKYLTPDEFHLALENLTEDCDKAPILLDVRNFYESKIGFFENALRPNLRKFSYFPAYVDENREVFNGRKVITYCTGGIRCERATTYLKKATECEEVFQLKGGIHKYLEQYPDGFYTGKLFVFDNRYSIGDSTCMTSQCFYCSTPHDDYELCTTRGCRQLVLICQTCRSKNITTCCTRCSQNAESCGNCKECSCTKERTRIPKEPSSIILTSSGS
ncbi:unnamed protein product [Clavelina lepadiformis]|uniref:Rhodanese domain-containing protein n=1 Tax=Clavelina lepadiformis TaxID=159417 RepID=A0ABP0GND3_CLALP